MVKYIAILTLALVCNASAFMRLGTNTFSSAYVGTQAVQTVRLGTNLIWQRSTTPPEYSKWMDSTLYSNCVFLMPFETNALSYWRDYSTASNHGILSADSPAWNATAGGSAYSDGAGKYIELPNSFGSLTNGTLSAWISQTNGLYNDLFDVGSSASLTVNFFLFYKIDSNKLRFQVNGAATDPIIQADTTATIGTNWTHIAMTMSGGAKLYINGVLQTVGFNFGSASTVAFFNNVTPTNTSIGRFRYGGTFYARSKGYYNDLMIFNRGLASNEIYSIYTNRAGVHGL